MFVVVPFTFIWRRDIQHNVKRLMAGEKMRYPKSKMSKSIVILIMVLLLNVFGTVKVATMSQGDMGTIDYEVIPTSGSAIIDIPQKIIVRFDTDIEGASRINHSIYYNEGEEGVEITDTWLDAKTLEIAFSRSFEQGERMTLKYRISSEIQDDILITNEIMLKYQ